MIGAGLEMARTDVTHQKWCWAMQIMMSCNADADDGDDDDTSGHIHCLR